MDRATLDKLTKDDLIELVLALEARHAAEMAALQQRIAELERQVGLNSGNTGKPPSSDGLKKPPRVGNLRQPSGKQSGGQPGHPGKTLRRTETPDTTVDHDPQACTTCGTALTAAMADLFGVTLVTATIARIGQEAAWRFQGFADAVRDHVAAAPLKHLDETGFRIGGKTQWLHIASTVLLTFYRTSPKRGSLLANVAGIVVHDHWKPYYTLEGVRHALCNAHHLRELKALVEIEKTGHAGCSVCCAAPATPPISRATGAYR